MNNNKNLSYKIGGAIAIIVVLVVLYKVSGVSEFFSIEGIRGKVESMGIYGPFFFILIYFAAVTVGLPGTIFTAVGGIVFGVWAGSLYNLIGATLGAGGAFGVARLFMGDALSQKFKDKKWFESLNKGLEQNGVNYILFVRLVPIFPFNGVNFGSALTRISFKDYIVGTVIGMAPAVVIYTNAAAEFGASAEEGFTISSGLLIALGLLGLLVLLPVLYKKYGKKKEV